MSLLLVFVAAKLAVVWGHAVPATFLAVIAYSWQDALIALMFTALEFALNKTGAGRRLTWIAYWAIVIYTVLNIPVGRVLFTPLTPPMLRAARGPLADSILQYVTLSNTALAAAILTLAASLPGLLGRLPRSLLSVGIVCTIGVVFVGPAAVRRVDTRGMDRNVITALAGSRAPLTTASPGSDDWRISRFPTEFAPANLARYAGSARGFNIVMVSLESTAAQYLPLFGARSEGGPDAMPNLSALAGNALVFENAYAVYPESIKGLFSVLCSAFPAFDSRPEEYENVDCGAVAEVLADSGYRTAMFHSGRFGYLGMESVIRGRGYQTLEDAGDIGGNYNSSFGVDEPATVHRMLKWIDSLPRAQPFFLTYLPIAGHHPYATPEPGPFRGPDEIDQYRNSLHYGDASLGALIEGLRVRGLEKNTLWVIYGDHGEAFHQHEGNYGHTFLLYEENVHVPFLIAAPGLMRGQERVGKVVSLVDTAPTILDLAGISPRANYQGRSMLQDAPEMALFFTDYSLGLLGLRDGLWKFIYETRSGRTELFELDRDSCERTDVSAREMERVAWYTQVVRGWCGAQRSYLASLSAVPARPSYRRKAPASRSSAARLP
jgi:hypothetical protein